MEADDCADIPLETQSTLETTVRGYISGDSGACSPALPVDSAWYRLLITNVVGGSGIPKSHSLHAVAALSRSTPSPGFVVTKEQPGEP